MNRICVLLIFYVFVFNGFLLSAVINNEQKVSGIVFEDVNKNGIRDDGEKGLPNILVCNQSDVVKTDGEGLYLLPLRDSAEVIFIVKPPQYNVPLNEDNLPQFYYIYQPKGTPEFKYPGIQPTGDLPESIDFPLYSTNEADTFEIIVLSDPQPRDDREIGYIRDDVVSELIGTNAVFGITLGDMMFDDLSLFPRYNKIISKIDIPFYQVPGNHDMNYDAKDDRYSLDTFKRHYGPAFYAFEYGKVSFIILDTVEWLGWDENDGSPKKSKQSPPYRGNLGEEQLQWLENYLRFVPSGNLIVFATHIPLYSSMSGEKVKVFDRDKLYEMVKNREHLLSISGHMHFIEQDNLNDVLGWSGEESFQQIICSAVSGSWWSGPLDVRGIPITEQRDGTPNGYHIFRFCGNQYTQKFKAANRGENFQIRISSPTGNYMKKEVDSLQVVVNVFNANENAKVEFQLDNNPGIQMTRTRMKDPFMVALNKEHKDREHNRPDPFPSSHIWMATLPEALTTGVHKIVIFVHDQYGNQFRQAGIFEVN